MAAPKGHPRYGGRKKGTPNKNTAGVQKEIEDRLGKSLPLAILDTFDELAAKDRAYIMLDLMNYFYPKRKALEHTIEVPEEVLHELEDIKDLSDKELDQLLKDE